MPDQTTQLNLNDGGTVGSSFRIEFGSEVNITGGNVGVGPIVNGGEVNINGGNVSANFQANSGSLVQISGGAVGDDFIANSGSEVNISGGNLGIFFVADSGSEVNISGGTLGPIFTVQSGGVVNISGGTFGMFLTADDSEMNIFGAEFFIDGVELDKLTPGQAFTITDRDVTLTALLADGEQQFSLDKRIFSPNAMLTVTLTSPVLLGDVNIDGVVDLFDIAPFIDRLATRTFQAEADIDGSGAVDFLDIAPFIGLLDQ